MRNLKTLKISDNNIAVNHGTLVTIDGMEYEMLGPGYSPHSTPMIAQYFSDCSSPKITIVYTPECIYTYRFHDLFSLEHYRASKKSISAALKHAVYAPIVKNLALIYSDTWQN